MISDSNDSYQAPMTPTRASNDSSQPILPTKTRWRTKSMGSASFLEVDSAAGGGKKIKATELLIIDIKKMSAVFNDAVWSFEQTYLPYLKGNGKVDVKMADGAIWLVFKLRRRQKDGSIPPKDAKYNANEWEPVLCLHKRSCSIGSVDLTMQGGGRLAWVVNKLALVFKGALCDYVVRAILNILLDKSGWYVWRLYYFVLALSSSPNMHLLRLQDFI